MKETEYGTFTLDLSKEFEPIDVNEIETDYNEMDIDNRLHWYEKPIGKLLND